MESSKLYQDILDSYLSYIQRDGLAFSHSNKMIFRNPTIKWTYPCACVTLKDPGKVECAGYQLTFSVCHTMFSKAVFLASYNLGLCDKGLKGQYIEWCNKNGKCKQLRFELAM